MASANIAASDVCAFLVYLGLCVVADWKKLGCNMAWVIPVPENFEPQPVM